MSVSQGIRILFKADRRRLSYSSGEGEEQMKTIITIILSSLITLCIVDLFFDIPYVYGNVSGILSGVIALFMINTKGLKEEKQ